MQLEIDTPISFVGGQIVKFDTGHQVDDKEMEKMHERAHQYCLIANSRADHVEMNIF